MTFNIPPGFFVLAGEPVYIVGFPLLKSEKPSVSHGIVSHLTKSGGPMLTSCCLHSGGSGAPLVRSDGSLLGIMTSFVCASETSARNFPRLSIAASADIFGEYLKTFLEKKGMYIKDIKYSKFDKRKFQSDWSVAPKMSHLQFNDTQIECK